MWPGSEQLDGETGAHLPTKPGPDGAGPGPGAGALLQGGAHSEHGPCGPGDHHGGAADLQTAQETGLCVCVCVCVLRERERGGCKFVLGCI